MKKIMIAVALSALSFSALAWEKVDNYSVDGERTITQAANGKNFTHLQVGNIEGVKALINVKMFNSCPEKVIIMEVDGLKYQGFQFSESYKGVSYCAKGIFGDSAEVLIQKMVVGTSIKVEGNTFSTVGFNSQYKAYVQ